MLIDNLLHDTQKLGIGGYQGAHKKILHKCVGGGSGQLPSE